MEKRYFFQNDFPVRQTKLAFCINAAVTKI